MQKGIRGRKVFSQNDEDGAIEDVFKHIGTTNKVLFNVVVWKNPDKRYDQYKLNNWCKVYVEFGVENCVQCNTRYLRLVEISEQEQPLYIHRKQPIP